MSDILAVVEWTAKQVRHIATVIAEQIAENRRGFSDSETGDFLTSAAAPLPVAADDPAAVSDSTIHPAVSPTAGSLTSQHRRPQK